jgi:hypothetical protein
MAQTSANAPIPLLFGLPLQCCARNCADAADKLQMAGRFAPSQRRWSMNVESLLNALGVVGIIGILLVGFQLRDRLDKIAQLLEKK